MATAIWSKPTSTASLHGDFPKKQILVIYSHGKYRGKAAKEVEEHDWLELPEKEKV